MLRITAIGGYGGDGQNGADGLDGTKGKICESVSYREFGDCKSKNIRGESWIVYGEDGTPGSAGGDGGAGNRNSNACG